VHIHLRQAEKAGWYIVIVDGFGEQVKRLARSTLAWKELFATNFANFAKKAETTKLS
jgi:hypothetical protein